MMVQPADTFRTVVHSRGEGRAHAVAVDGHYLAPEAWSDEVLREGSSVDTNEWTGAPAR